MNEQTLFAKGNKLGKSHTKQGQGVMEGVGVMECFVLPKMCLWWQTCEQQHYQVAKCNCWCATSQSDICEQHCRCIEGLICIHALSFRDELKMNQPIKVKEYNQLGLDIGLRLKHILWLRRWSCLPLTWHLFCFWFISINSGFIVSEYKGHEVWIIFWLTHKGKCKLTCSRSSVSLTGNMGMSFADIYLICESSVRIL